ncbi:hypothetical protein D7V94_12715 [Parablautia intestinalis]|jgi:hypothetical protein|uniref:Uncharacterized protein n=1 Tax=Parablautia intestinalis TaxID=2320100 RepID=A0A3A9AGY0_9FIRM|nr:hypothetical protein [Parablautia intestinalis]MCI8613823.1 hypothetical protein [Lachnospiraceae bacterium]RKI90647.1 hypothetical protein D7V94_12715 [Parablautia intestinalis]
MTEKWESFKETLDDVKSMSKREFLLIIAVCILGGIVFGMLFSPRKSVMLGSYNGSNNKGKDNNSLKEEDEILDWED